jgi:hypothetical protein
MHMTPRPAVASVAFWSPHLYGVFHTQPWQVCEAPSITQNFVPPRYDSCAFANGTFIVSVNLLLCPSQKLAAGACLELPDIANGENEETRHAPPSAYIISPEACLSWAAPKPRLREGEREIHKERVRGGRG